ncbi:thioredoxin family protein [Oscillospiraceae bacterium WX1]
MSIIKFIRKKETSCCGSGDADGKCCEKPAEKTVNSNARFVVLGACCQKSTDTFNNVRQAVKELGLTDDVVNVGDALEIAKYGVMQTPGLVVDGKVVSYGKLLKVDDVKKIFNKLGVK